MWSVVAIALLGVVGCAAFVGAMLMIIEIVCRFWGNGPAQPSPAPPPPQPTRFSHGAAKNAWRQRR